MNRIKDLRESKGWTQSKLASKISVKQQSVARYENEDHGLSVDLIVRLCDIFDCSADYLLCLSDNPHSELSAEDAALLTAYRKAPKEIRTIVDTALFPYRKDATTATTA